MAKKNSVKEFFKKLKIKESDYPVYINPDQFSSGIKKCSLLKFHEIRYSNTTVSQRPNTK